MRTSCTKRRDNGQSDPPIRRSVGHGCLAALLMALGISCFSSVADTVWLQGGEKLVGKVMTEDNAKVVFQSQTLGRLEILRDRIQHIERDTTASPNAPLFTNQTTASVLPDSAMTNEFQPWTAGPPGSEALDWIQLKSGEWLAGKLKSLQDDKLEFDSEELDVHTFDWKDIRAVRSPRLHSVRLENLKPIDGSLRVTTNAVQVLTSTATNTYPRSELIAITPTGNRELDKWSAKVSTGVTFRAGNTRQVDVNGHAELLRRTPDTRLNLDYEVNYGKLNGVQNEQNHRFIGQFDYFLSRKLYVRVPDVEYFRDPLQNLDHRITAGAGVGYDLLKTSRVEWNATVSPSWQRNWFNSVLEGESSTADSVALVLSTHFDVELTQRLDFIFDYRGQLTGRQTGNTTHHTKSTLEFEIHKRLKLDLSFEWDRISDPKTESGGNGPTPDDFRLITSLGVDF